ncbi:uncharacterized protein LOC108103894 [Drosophila eugracilis]|uniref:uncharacterized protein LOC108103894 n=1 Tax=Drosophila eugracilis TaxID=29029 RepID=UPI0007E6586D|nr:uncharacterized protein LOC108103894 [Drosophila eugracilis]
MHNLIKSRALFAILKNPLPDNYFDDSGEESDTKDVVAGGLVKLSASAPEFVPSLMSEELAKDEDYVGLADIRNIFMVENEQKNAKPTLALLPWKGFPKIFERNSRNSEVLLVDDSDYVIVPRSKGRKISYEELKQIDTPKTPLDGMENATQDKLATNASNVLPDFPPLNDRLVAARERRREQERKVAVEALKLAEQRRLRGPFVSIPNPNNGKPEKVQPVVHLSRLPISFSKEERVVVNRMRVAKKERIEKALVEMAKEEEDQENLRLGIQERNLARGRYQRNSTNEEEVAMATTSDTVPKRYIPTAKQWNEIRRARHLAKIEAEKENKKPAKNKGILTNFNENNNAPSQIIRNANPDVPTNRNWRPPTHPLVGERRNGNITHYREIPKWSFGKTFRTPMNMSNLKIPKVVQRYTIEELLHFEPQPEDLEDPKIDVSLKKFGFLRI